MTSIIDDLNVQRLILELLRSWDCWDIPGDFYSRELPNQLISQPELREGIEVSVFPELMKALGRNRLSLLPNIIEQVAQERRTTGGPQAGDGQRAQERSRRKRLEQSERETARLETLREEAARQLAERRRERLEQRRLEIARQAELRENAKRELLVAFDQDFLEADALYHASYSGILPRDGFLALRSGFVQQWLAQKIGATVDDEQAAAIGVVEAHVQVVARAGSGKTRTLVNRALFLQLHCGVSPDEMLLLAFNRDAADEMRNRLRKVLGKRPLPWTMDFHQLAYCIVQPMETLVYDEPNGVDSKSRLVQDLIDEYRQDDVYLQKIRRFMLANFRQDWEEIVFGGWDLGPDEMLAYRRSLSKVGLDGRHYKSFGEKLIADTLVEYDVKYKYEYAVEWADRPYRPDFTLPKRKLVIEYFGRAGESEYDAQSEAKREYWRAKPQWRLIELSTVDFRNHGADGFYRELIRLLASHGVKLRRLTDEEIWEQVKERAVDSFSKLMAQFVQRARKRFLSARDLAELVRQHTCDSEIEEWFLELAVEFYAAYLDRLRVSRADDFDGLMQRAVQTVEDGQTTFQRDGQRADFRRIRYLLIDEYQDFSEQFHRLVQGIRKCVPDSQVFAVGDDWQSIYRFAGADTTFYNAFSQAFHPASRLNLTSNYRSVRGVVALGNSVMANRGVPGRVVREDPGSVRIADPADFEPDTREQERHGDDRFTPAVLRLVGEGLARGHGVMLLSRTNRLNRSIHSRGGRGDSNTIESFAALIRSYLPEDQRQRVTASTAHRSKGLERQTVIVLDGEEGRYPLLHPHMVFTRVFGDSVATAVDEERRLFYVALSRASDNLVILRNRHSGSPFLNGTQIEVLQWCAIPPLAEPEHRLLISVCNQAGRGATPTVSIKDHLKRDAFIWREGIAAWEKSISSEGFSLDCYLAEAAWVSLADGVDVRARDLLSDRVLASCSINGGEPKEYLSFASSSG